VRERKMAMKGERMREGEREREREGIHASK